MESANKEESALQKRKAAAQRRLEEHIEWKREFFQARPPPPPIGQLHRRQQGKTKDHACHAAFQCALGLHQQTHQQQQEIVAEAEQRKEEMNSRTGEAGTAAAPQLTSSAETDASNPHSKRDAWAARLHGEKERRNPSTDLNVRSDPTRTVIMANLHPDTVDEDLRHFADQFGRVVSVRIVRHHKTGKSRRYAFVEFGHAGEARRALQFHRRKRLKGHAIIIDREKGRTEAGFLPRRIATAEAFLLSQKAPNCPYTVVPHEQGQEVKRNAPARDGHHQGTVGESAAGLKAAASSIPDDDDNFLNSILNS